MRKFCIWVITQIMWLTGKGRWVQGIFFFQLCKQSLWILENSRLCGSGSFADPHRSTQPMCQIMTPDIIQQSNSFNKMLRGKKGTFGLHIGLIATRIDWRVSVAKEINWMESGWTSCLKCCGNKEKQKRAKRSQILVRWADRNVTASRGQNTARHSWYPTAIPKTAQALLQGKGTRTCCNK